MEAHKFGKGSQDADFQRCCSDASSLQPQLCMAQCCRHQALEWFSLSVFEGHLGHQGSVISRISNAKVLQESGQPQLSRQLLKQQLLLYGRVARAPDSDPLRMLTFAPGTLLPATGEYIRRIGRPRNQWAVMLYKEYCKMGVGLNRSIHIELDWRAAVCQYCIN